MYSIKLRTEKKQQLINQSCILLWIHTCLYKCRKKSGKTHTKAINNLLGKGRGAMCWGEGLVGNFFLRMNFIYILFT